MKPAKANERLVAAAANDSPPTVLEPLLMRLGAGGATEVSLEKYEDDDGDFVYTQGRGVQAGTRVEWEACEAPIATALKVLATNVQRFDLVRRLFLAASDMSLCEEAANALLNADRRGALERVIETGLVVTFTRPYLDSNDAGVPQYRPRDPDDRSLLEHIESLRDDVHAHAGQTKRRIILDAKDPLFRKAGENENSKLRYIESYSSLSRDQLRRIADLASRQTQTLTDAAVRLDDEFHADLEHDGLDSG